MFVLAVDLLIVLVFVCVNDAQEVEPWLLYAIFPSFPVFLSSLSFLVQNNISEDAVFCENGMIFDQ